MGNLHFTWRETHVSPISTIRVCSCEVTFSFVGHASDDVIAMLTKGKVLEALKVGSAWFYRVLRGIFSGISIYTGFYSLTKK